MKKQFAFAAAALVLGATAQANTGSAFYGDAPDAHHPWAVHDWNRPQPPCVEPLPYDAEKAKAPADAVVLCDGTEATLANWECDKPEGGATKWIVKDGAFQCVPKSGYVRTKAKFGDCKLHVEWAAPTPPQGESQGRGNSGIFLEGLVEIQVLDNYDNPTYADGFACSMYGVSPPLANALRKPGEWQSIDIEFRRPLGQDGKITDPGFVTVYCNGVLMQDRVQIEGGTGHKGRSKPSVFPDVGPLKLQDHGNPVRYRNIWYQALPPRTAADVAKHSPLSEEETLAKRKEIAAMVRADAAKLGDQPVNQMLRLTESLVYEMDEATKENVHAKLDAYVAGLQQLPKDKLLAKKDEVKHVREAFQYLIKFHRMDADCPHVAALEKIVKAHGWDKK
jgi:hypothetical protein